MAHSTQSKGTVLIIMSGADYIRTASGAKQETGFFLKELGRPLVKLLDAGYDVEFASPHGEKPHMDPLSDNKLWFLPHPSEKEREMALLQRLEAERNFGHPRAFADIHDAELDRYVAVFIPGGHAPMTDLPHDAELGRILLHFHTRQKPTASICHGPPALLSTKLRTGGEWPYKGYKMTCYSNTEEKTNELMWRDKIIPKAEDMLRENGAIMNEGFPLMAKVTRDRELITGQNPTSADPMADELLRALAGTREA